MKNYYESNKEFEMETNVDIDIDMHNHMMMGGMTPMPMQQACNCARPKPFGRIMPCNCGKKAPCNCHNNMMGMGGHMGMGNGPIMEPMQEKVIHKDICHEIKHICPVNTKYVNNHIYKHVYVPQYTCSTEDVCTTIDQGSCCNFR